MRVEGRSAVRTDDSEIVDAVVGAHSVDVIKNQANLLATPDVALPADLADRALQSLSVKALLEIAPAIRGMLDENFLDRLRGVGPLERIPV
jgi:hypothetical protein